MLSLLVLLYVSGHFKQIFFTELLNFGYWTIEILDVRGEHKKSGLTSEALTRVLEQLEQNGQVLQIPHIICNNLVYSSFF